MPLNPTEEKIKEEKIRNWFVNQTDGIDKVIVELISHYQAFVGDAPKVLTAPDLEQAFEGFLKAVRFRSDQRFAMYDEGMVMQPLDFNNQNEAYQTVINAIEFYLTFAGEANSPIVNKYFSDFSLRRFVPSGRLATQGSFQEVVEGALADLKKAAQPLQQLLTSDKLYNFIVEENSFYKSTEELIDTVKPEDFPKAQRQLLQQYRDRLRNLKQLEQQLNLNELFLNTTKPTQQVVEELLHKMNQPEFHDYYQALIELEHTGQQLIDKLGNEGELVDKIKDIQNHSLLYKGIRTSLGAENGVLEDLKRGVATRIAEAETKNPKQGRVDGNNFLARQVLALHLNTQAQVSSPAAQYFNDYLKTILEKMEGSPFSKTGRNAEKQKDEILKALGCGSLDALDPANFDTDLLVKLKPQNPIWLALISTKPVSDSFPPRAKMEAYTTLAKQVKHDDAMGSHDKYLALYTLAQSAYALAERYDYDRDCQQLLQAHFGPGSGNREEINEKMKSNGNPSQNAAKKLFEQMDILLSNQTPTQTVDAQAGASTSSAPVLPTEPAAVTPTPEIVPEPITEPAVVLPTQAAVVTPTPEIVPEPITEPAPVLPTQPAVVPPTPEERGKKRAGTALSTDTTPIYRQSAEVIERQQAVLDKLAAKKTSLEIMEREILKSLLKKLGRVGDENKSLLADLETAIGLPPDWQQRVGELLAFAKPDWEQIFNKLGPIQPDWHRVIDLSGPVQEIVSSSTLKKYIPAMIPMLSATEQRELALWQQQELIQIATWKNKQLTPFYIKQEEWKQVARGKLDELRNQLVREREGVNSGRLPSQQEDVKEELEALIKFAKENHSPFTSELNEIINSSQPLLEQYALLDAEMHLTRHVAESCETEVRYHNDMKKFQILLSECLNDKSNKFSADDRATIEQYVDALKTFLATQEQLNLSNILSNFETTPDAAAAELNKIVQEDTFDRYINATGQLAMLGERLNTNSFFAKYPDLQSKIRGNFNNNAMDQILTRPAQRVPRIQLFIKDITKDIDKIIKSPHVSEDRRLAARGLQASAPIASSKVLQGGKKIELMVAQDSVKRALVAESNDRPGSRLAKILELNLNSPRQEPTVHKVACIGDYLAGTLASAYPELFRVEGNSNEFHVLDDSESRKQALGLQADSKLRLEQFDARALQSLYEEEPNPLWLVLKSATPITEGKFSPQEKIETYIQLARLFQAGQLNSENQYQDMYNLARAAAAIAAEYPQSPECNELVKDYFGPKSNLGRYISAGFEKHHLETAEDVNENKIYLNAKEFLESLKEPNPIEDNKDKQLDAPKKMLQDIRNRYGSEAELINKLREKLRSKDGTHGAKIKLPDPGSRDELKQLIILTTNYLDNIHQSTGLETLRRDAVQLLEAQQRIKIAEQFAKELKSSVDWRSNQLAKLDVEYRTFVASEVLLAEDLRAELTAKGLTDLPPKNDGSQQQTETELGALMDLVPVTERYGRFGALTQRWHILQKQGQTIKKDQQKAWVLSELSSTESEYMFSMKTLQIMLFKWLNTPTPKGDTELSEEEREQLNVFLDSLNKFFDKPEGNALSELLQNTEKPMPNVLQELVRIFNSEEFKSNVRLSENFAADLAHINLGAIVAVTPEHNRPTMMNEIRQAAEIYNDIDEVKVKHKDNHNVGALSIMPVQRFPRYVLLAREILKAKVPDDNILVYDLIETMQSHGKAIDRSPSIAEVARYVNKEQKSVGLDGKTVLLKNILGLNRNSPLFDTKSGIPEINKKLWDPFSLYLSQTLPHYYPDIFTSNNGQVTINENVDENMGKLITEALHLGSGDAALNPATFNPDALQQLFERTGDPLWLVLKSTKPITEPGCSLLRVNADPTERRSMVTELLRGHDGYIKGEGGVYHYSQMTKEFTKLFPREARELDILFETVGTECAVVANEDAVAFIQRAIYPDPFTTEEDIPPYEDSTPEKQRLTARGKVETYIQLANHYANLPGKSDYREVYHLAKAAFAIAEKHPECSDLVINTFGQGTRFAKKITGVLSRAERPEALAFFAKIGAPASTELAKPDAPSEETKQMDTSSSMTESPTEEIDATSDSASDTEPKVLSDEQIEQRRKTALLQHRMAVLVDSQLSAAKTDEERRAFAVQYLTTSLTPSAKTKSDQKIEQEECYLKTLLAKGFPDLFELKQVGMEQRLDVRGADYALIIQALGLPSTEAEIINRIAAKTLNRLDPALFNRDILDKLCENNDKNKPLWEALKLFKPLNEEKDLEKAKVAINQALELESGYTEGARLAEILKLNLNSPLENPALEKVFCSQDYLEQTLASVYPQYFTIEQPDDFLVAEGLADKDLAIYEALERALGLHASGGVFKLDPKEFDPKKLEELCRNEKTQHQAPLWLVLKSTIPISESFSPEQKIWTYIRLANLFPKPYEKFTKENKYQGMYNLARAAAAVAEAYPECKKLVQDNFGPESDIGKYILKRGSKTERKQAKEFFATLKPEPTAAVESTPALDQGAAISAPKRLSKEQSIAHETIESVASQLQAKKAGKEREDWALELMRTALPKLLEDKSPEGIIKADSYLKALLTHGFPALFYQSETTAGQQRLNVKGASNLLLITEALGYAVPTSSTAVKQQGDNLDPALFDSVKLEQLKTDPKGNKETKQGIERRNQLWDALTELHRVAKELTKPANESPTPQDTVSANTDADVTSVLGPNEGTSGSVPSTTDLDALGTVKQTEGDADAASIISEKPKAPASDSDDDFWDPLPSPDPSPTGSSTLATPSSQGQQRTTPFDDDADSINPSNELKQESTDNAVKKPEDHVDLMQDGRKAERADGGADTQLQTPEPEPGEVVTKRAEDEIEQLQSGGDATITLPSGNDGSISTPFDTLFDELEQEAQVGSITTPAPQIPEPVPEGASATQQQVVTDTEANETPTAVIKPVELSQEGGKLASEVAHTIMTDAVNKVSAEQEQKNERASITESTHSRITGNVTSGGGIIQQQHVNNRQGPEVQGVKKQETVEGPEEYITIEGQPVPEQQVTVTHIELPVQAPAPVQDSKSVVVDIEADETPPPVQKPIEPSQIVGDAIMQVGDPVRPMQDAEDAASIATEPTPPPKTGQESDLVSPKPVSPIEPLPQAIVPTAPGKTSTSTVAQSSGLNQVTVPAAAQRQGGEFEARATSSRGTDRSEEGGAQKQKEIELNKAIESLKAALKKIKEPKSKATGDENKRKIARHLFAELEQMEGKPFSREKVKDVIKILYQAERAMSHHTNWFKSRNTTSYTSAFTNTVKDFNEARGNLECIQDKPVKLLPQEDIIKDTDKTKSLRKPEGSSEYPFTYKQQQKKLKEDVRAHNATNTDGEPSDRNNKGP